MKMNKQKLKRRQIIEKIINEMGLNIRKDEYIIINKEDLLFKIYLWGNLIEVEYPSCFKCDLDCNKTIYIDISPTEYIWNDMEYLTNEDISRLGKILTIIEYPEKIDIEEIKLQLKEQIKRIKFIILGFNDQEISEIFHKIQGEVIEVDFLKNCQCKILETFPQLLIELCIISKPIFENLISDRPAPIILEFIKDVYGFLIISDSDSIDVTKIKTKILPMLYKHNPFALCLVIGLHYGEKNYLKPELIEKILNRKVYGVIYNEKVQNFMEILYKSVLLRINQMRDSNCPFIEDEK